MLSLQGMNIVAVTLPLNVSLDLGLESARDGELS